MRKISWLLATVGGAALVSAAAVQGVAASDGPGPATVLKFSTMTPVTGPYVGPPNPVRGVAGGGLPWILTAGTGSLKRDGHLLVRVRGLVLARQAPVPPALQGTNPFPGFRAVVSCQSIGAGNTAAITNISTGDFKASTAGDSTINARVSLPKPCIAPIVFVTGPTGTDAWFAVTGS
ncbi:MAG TPA: hypothetical protein VF933_17155 [Streptosporangiaceae bacterium]